jgi:hypothetical protein
MGEGLVMRCGGGRGATDREFVGCIDCVCAINGPPNGSLEDAESSFVDVVGLKGANCC